MRRSYHRRFQREKIISPGAQQQRIFSFILVDIETSHHHHQFWPTFLICKAQSNPENPKSCPTPHLTRRLAARHSAPNDSLNWDKFGDFIATQSNEELDSGSWHPIFELDPFKPDPAIHPDVALMDDDVLEIEDELDSSSRHL
ncbi:hypothetical protein ACFXTN_042462 [Malus domestica]